MKTNCLTPFNSSWHRLLICLTLLLGSVLSQSCQRPSTSANGNSVVDFQVPRLTSEKLNAMGVTDGLLPTGKKACFGIDVKGPGIPAAAPSSCSSQLGIYSGFVEEGGLLSVVVPMGEARVFRLLMLLVDTGMSCPALSAAYLSSGSPFSSIYNAGQTNPIAVNLPSMNVTINFSYTSATSSIATLEGIPACASTATHTPGLRGILFSSGQVRNASSVPFDDPNDTLSHPTVESIWKVNIAQTGSTGFGVVSTGGVLTDPTLPPSEVPRFLQSFTRKPDTSEVFAIDHGGQVYSVSGSVATLLTSGSCPFASCDVPVWMQSISAGMGPNLYGLDHAGNIYQITSVGPSFLNQTVSPAVSQVIYY